MTQDATTHTRSRNPFGVMDVPDPNDADVAAFAASAMLAGDAADDNAKAWARGDDAHDGIEGEWTSRWNGGADSTIANDAAEKWKQGEARVRSRANASICHSNGAAARARG